VAAVLEANLMASLSKFNAELENIGTNIVPKMARKMTLVSAITLHGKIVRKTRVDTGNARANWNINPGEANNAVSTISKPGIGADAAAGIAAAGQSSLAALKPYEKVTISNNVEYILTLENGGPKFGAGDKMVAISMNEFRLEAPVLFKLITFTNFNDPVN
jgi:hypothetical protein